MTKTHALRASTCHTLGTPMNAPTPAMTTAQTPSPRARLRWRVVVRTAGLDPSRPSRPLSWHLASCTSPERADAHCAEGRRLLTAHDDPEGHCLLDGVCPRNPADG